MIRFVVENERWESGCANLVEQAEKGREPSPILGADKDDATSRKVPSDIGLVLVPLRGCRGIHKRALIENTEALCGLLDERRIVRREHHDDSEAVVDRQCRGEDHCVRLSALDAPVQQTGRATASYALVGRRASGSVQTELTGCHLRRIRSQDVLDECERLSAAPFHRFGGKWARRIALHEPLDRRAQDRTVGDDDRWCFAIDRG
ncbi:MAG: hypothetical protein ACKV2T_31910 [Kofleriaceae bacterium]